MNPHSFTENLKLCLEDVFTGTRIHTAVTEEERERPYVLLSLVANEEKILRNHTWDCELSVSLYTNAHDATGPDMQRLFSELCSCITRASLQDAMNEKAADFYLYRLSLLAVDEPMPEEDNFIQTARFRALIQF